MERNKCTENGWISVKVWWFGGDLYWHFAATGNAQYGVNGRSSVLEGLMVCGKNLT